MYKENSKQESNKKTIRFISFTPLGVGSIVVGVLLGVASIMGCSTPF